MEVFFTVFANPPEDHHIDVTNILLKLVVKAVMVMHGQREFTHS
jgi:hypothetical protein